MVACAHMKTRHFAFVLLVLCGFGATQAHAATITSFAATAPNNISGAVTLSWDTSEPTDVTIDFSCDDASIALYVKEDNRTIPCIKGALVSYENQQHNVITVQPKGNTTEVDVTFSLKVLRNGGWTGGADDEMSMKVRFPAQAPATAAPLACGGGALFNSMTGAVCPGVEISCNHGALYNAFTGSPCPDIDVDPRGQQRVCLDLQNLGYRSKGSAVSDLQFFLQRDHYLASEPTGYYGLLTVQAVKAFQNDVVITPTGYVGPLTRAKIKELTCN